MFEDSIHTPLPENGIVLSIGPESAEREERASGITCLGFAPTIKKPSSPKYCVETDFCLLATSCNLNKTKVLETGKNRKLPKLPLQVYIDRMLISSTWNDSESLL